MTAHSPVAQVEVESQMRKIEAEVDDLKDSIIFVDINSMTAHSPVAQVEVESQMRKIEAEVDDLKETIKGHENEYKEATREERKDILGQMIIAKEGRLHDLSEELKTVLPRSNHLQSHLNATDCPMPLPTTPPLPGPIHPYNEIEGNLNIPWNAVLYPPLKQRQGGCIAGDT
jgi:phenylalanyl-tRNA synthetase alpha subunit